MGWCDLCLCERIREMHVFSLLDVRMKMDDGEKRGMIEREGKNGWFGYFYTGRWRFFLEKKDN